MLRRAAALIILFLTAALLTGPPGAASARSESGGYVFEKEWAFGSDTEHVHGMDVSPSGEVFAVGNRVNQDRAKVRRYGADGTLTHTWEVPYKSPGDLAVDASGNVHISDYWGDVFTDHPSTVHVYSRDGALLRSYARHAHWGDSNVGAIAFDTAGNSFVTDPVEDLVYKFAPDGTHLLDFGGSGVAPGQFDSPWGVEVGPDGNVYVSDAQNHRIQVFSPEGTFLRMWGQSGTSAGQVFTPGDVTTTPSGNLAVLDWTSRVQEFRLDGTFVRDLGDAHLRDNGDVAFGPSEAMYVSGYLASVTRGIAKYGVAEPPTPPTRPVGKLKVSRKPMKVKKRTLVLSVVCPKRATGGCRGVARVRVGTKVITTKRRYAVQAGKTARVKLRVTKQGMRRIKRKPTRAVAELSAPGARKPIVKRKIRIRR